MQDSFIVKKCVLTMFGTLFGRRKTLVFQKVSLIPVYLTSKVRPLFLSYPAFSHAPCNCQACTETRPSTFIMALVLVSKLCIFKNSHKLSYHLKWASWFQLFDILKTCFHNLKDARCITMVIRLEPITSSCDLRWINLQGFRTSCIFWILFNQLISLPFSNLLLADW